MTTHFLHCLISREAQRGLHQVFQGSVHAYFLCALIRSARIVFRFRIFPGAVNLD